MLTFSHTHIHTHTMSRRSATFQCPCAQPMGKLEGTEVEMSFIQPEAEDEIGVEPSGDVTCRLLRHCHGYRRLFCLILNGVCIFTLAVLLVYMVLSGRGQACSEKRGSDQRLVNQVSGGLYLGELRERMRRHLLDEHIEDTVRRVSSTPHPPGSAEGDSLASEVLRRLQSFHMDHTWTSSYSATLQFPHRTKQNSLCLVGSEDQILEEIHLNPLDYCPYSAMAMATGGVVYANYGRPEDFNWLKSAGVSVTGHLVVMRVGGGLSFAEKVRLAEKNGGGGALIYPDPADLPQDPRRLGLTPGTAVSEHVHLGSGDPFTPGFPSFDHTQFPPLQSSGLPLIPAQPISATAAARLLRYSHTRAMENRVASTPGTSQQFLEVRRPECPKAWRGRLSLSRCVLGPDFSAGDGRRAKMAVHNTMETVLLNNIFSSLEGRVEPDQYVILGAQRDSWGPGAVKSGVGTAILLELARTFTAMVHNGFSPRRSVLFVSWDAGDFGNVGATEWLEGYLSMLHLKAVAYFSLDQAVMGDDILSAYTSPLLADLLDTAVRQVQHPKHSGQTIYTHAEKEGGSWRIVKPLYVNSGAYSFTAFAGVPAMELHFSQERMYPFVNTPLDTAARLQEVVGGRLGVTGRSLSELVGEMVLRLVYDRILPLRITSYAHTVLQLSAQLNRRSSELQARGVSPQCLFRARGQFSRAAESLQRAAANSDANDQLATQYYNTLLLKVESYFLSQYVSVLDAPFRHVIEGRGQHTLHALSEHLALLTSDPNSFQEDRFRRQLALFTWTIEGAANALTGHLWNTHTLSY